MAIIDSQIHIWEDDSAGRPWNREYGESRKWFLCPGDPVTTERAVDSMDQLGVDLAILTTLPLYGDIEYEQTAVRQYSERFRIAVQLDLSVPHPEEIVEIYAQDPAVVAVRLSFTFEQDQYYVALHEGAYDPIFRTAERHGLPVMLAVLGRPQEVAPLAHSFGNLQLVVDHLAIDQGRPGVIPEDPFSVMEALLELAIHPNITLKLSGLPTVSKGAYPFVDLWPYLHQIIDAFGPERLIWASDFSRTRPMYSYAEGLDYLRESSELSDGEKRLILGESAERLFHLDGNSVNRLRG
jgi:L-fuconolactonase